MTSFEAQRGGRNPQNSHVAMPLIMHAMKCCEFVLSTIALKIVPSIAVSFLVLFVRPQIYGYTAS